MQGALILGLTASCIASSVAGHPNPDDNALAIASNMDLAYSKCDKHPKDALFADLPACSQAKAIEEGYCGLVGIKDNAVELELHRHCLCSLPFFEGKTKCHDCVLAEGGLTLAQYKFFDAVIQKAQGEFCDPKKTPTEPFSEFWLKLVDSTELRIEEVTTCSELPEHTAAPEHNAAPHHAAAPEHSAVSLTEANTDASVCCENYFTPEEMDKALLQLAEATEEEDTPDEADEEDTPDEVEEGETPKSVVLLPGGQTINMTGVNMTGVNLGMNKRSLHGKRSRCVGAECLYCTTTTEEKQTVVNMKLSKKRPTDCCKGDYKQCTKSTAGGTTVDVRVLRNGTIISKIYYHDYDITKVATGGSGMTSSSALILFGCALMGMLATVL